jgi:D-alanyl-D-alanine carboxypeptidase
MSAGDTIGRILRQRASYLNVSALLVTFLLYATPSLAQIGSDRYSSIVMDASSGAVLSSVNADELRHPASLTKMMTLYMVFEALRDRRISHDELVPVSYHAASMEPTKLGLTPATRITVEDAILSLVTMSANDAAAALGELLGGSEDRFAEMMTLRARALDMHNTTFRNASGLPDPEQYSTARDMAVLARHLIRDFPDEYHYFSTPSFVFHRRVIYNHDHMLKLYPGADGMKTGYTNASGLNLVTSAVRGDVRLIGVVFGAANGNERDVHMASLLDQGYEREDVPIQPRHEQTLSARLPSLISPVQAATLPLPPHIHPPAVLQPHWSIQIGGFGSETLLRRALQTARQSAEAGDLHVETALIRGHANWRGQLSGLTQAEAATACAALARQKIACVAMRADSGQLASR